ncbi:MAG: thioesterase family protein [Sandaracinaceae bacterium]
MSSVAERDTAALEGFPVQLTLPVRWGDMDAFAHVNNTVYFQYFESARIAYFERMGIIEGTPSGAGPILASTQCRFRAPVTYPDTVTVGARIPEVGDDRFRMEYAVWSERLATVAAKGEGVVVSFDYASGSKIPLPEAWRAAIAEIEG